MYEGQENGLTYLASLKPIKRNGAIIEVIASCVDITQRKCAENALQEAEALYRCLVENALVGVYLYQNGKIVYANPVFCSIFGYSQNEITTLDLIDLFINEEREYMKNKLTYGQDKYGSANREYKVRGIGKDGSIVDLEGNSTLTLFQGKPALIGTILDITERKETDRQYQRQLKLSPEPIMLHKDDTIIYVNDAGLKLLGTRDPLEVIGYSFIELFHPNDQEHVQKTLNTVLKNDHSTGFSEYKLVRLDGNVVEVESSAIHIYKYMGEAVIQSVFRDVTERKQAEEFMRRSEKLSLVGQMAAGVAHEIRNPLTSIKGFSQLLKEKNDSYRDYYEIMISELDRINEIVNEFMYLAKPNPIEFKKVRLSSILDHVISLMNTQAIMNNVNIHVTYDNDRVSINCDENQIKQVFINILKNAVESMPRGGEIITHYSTSSEQDEVHVKFTDQGIGIPQDRLRKIGEPFYTTKEQGTGLGLMLSYKIIESHKGRMNIQSEINIGTTIEIVLPNG
nr:MULTISPECIES: PAS domain-containing sensor histidine kinase [unclassified Paenibacillus]